MSSPAGHACQMMMPMTAWRGNAGDGLGAEEEEGDKLGLLSRSAAPTAFTARMTTIMSVSLQFCQHICLRTWLCLAGV